MSSSYPPEDDYAFPPQSQDPPARSEDREYDDDIYKKWFRTKQKSGFLSVRPFFQAGKVNVDIGELGDGGLAGNTAVYCNAIELAVYLRAVVDGRAESLYPKRDKNSSETFHKFGGAKVKGKAISRVLHIGHWETGTGENKQFDPTAFVWKTGHFEARETQSGAFIPDMGKMLSRNLIKVSRVEMAEISYRLDMALTSYTTKTDNAFKFLNGNAR